MSALTQTLSWQDRPLRALLALTWPMALSTMSYGVMGLVDTYFVAYLGEHALAGVGLAGVVGYVLVIFPFGVMRGAKVRVSQWIGAGEQQQLPQELGGTVAMAAVLGLAALATGFAMTPFLSWGTSHPADAAVAEDFLSVWRWGTPFMVLKVGLREYRYGLGDSRGPLYAALVGNLINLVLDPIFIFGLNWGVAGAAFATVLGHTAELTVLILRQLRRGPLPRRAPAKRLAALWRVGFPSGIQMLFELGAFATLTWVIGVYSSAELAAHQVAIQVIHLSFLPALAAAEAASVLAGQAVGAGRPELVYRVSRRGLALVVAYGLLWTVLLANFSEAIAGAFATTETLQQTVAALLHIAALFQILDGAQMVARAVLRGTGDVRVPAAIGIVVAWVVTPGLGWVMVHHLSLGASGGWIAITLEIGITAAAFWWRLLRGAWQGRRVVTFARWRPPTAGALQSQWD